MPNLSLAGRGVLAGGAAVVAVAVIAVLYSRQGAPQEAYLMLWESYTWTALGGADGRLSRRVQELGSTQRISVEVAVLDPRAEPRTALRERLVGGAYSGVILGPIAAQEVSVFAADFPTVRFVALSFLGAPQAGAPLPNTIDVYFAREAAYRDAGVQLADQQGIRSLGVVSAVDPPEAVGALVAAFRERAADAVVSETQINPAHDRVQIRRVLEDLKDAGAEAVLLWLGEQTSFALQVCETEGLRAVVSNWSWAEPRPQSVILSIDDDVVGAIAVALAAEPGQTEVAAPVVVRATGEPPSNPGPLQRWFGRLTQGWN